MKVLVTGGAGYIGTHTCVELAQAGHDIVVIDNFSNSSLKSIGRIKYLIGRDFPFYKIDIKNKTGLKKVFTRHSIDAVIGFAGLKSALESIKKPIEYYNNNVVGAVTLFEVMQQFDCKTFLFSSSATVYGVANTTPIKENSSLSAINPYGRSKLMVEQILQDMFIADNSWRIALLRYFNPIGAHKSGLIGESPRGIPNNLIPYISQVAIGKIKKLRVFGNDYNTHDGTCIRDYIHVVDLANGHIKVLDYLAKKPQVLVLNLGTGKGCSVFDVVTAFEQACGHKIPYDVVARRMGDVAKCYADPSLATKKLGWRTKLELNEMCQDSWHWQLKNPSGY